MSILDTTFMFLNKGKWYLAYCSDIKPHKIAVNSGEFLRSIITRFLEHCENDTDIQEGELTQLETVLNSLVTDDDDVNIVEYYYGVLSTDEDISDYSTVLMFIVILLLYVCIVIKNDISDYPNLYDYYMSWIGESNLFSDISDEFYSADYVISNEVPELYNLNGTDYRYLRGLLVSYIDNMTKFREKYATVVQNDEIYNIVLGSDDVLLVLPYICHIWWSEDADNGAPNLDTSKLVLEYGDKSFTLTTPSYSTIAVTYNSDTFDGEYSLSQEDVKNIFDVHNDSNRDNKFLHFKVYLDKKVSYPLPIKEITISSTSLTTYYDGKPYHGIAGISSGEIASGDQMSIVPIEYVEPGEYQSGFVYQTTYAQPQARVYEVTRDCGTITITPRTKLDLSSWAKSRYSSTYQSMTQLPQDGMDYLGTVSGTNNTKMFQNCSGLTSLDTSNWYTGDSTNMSYMFQACSSLTTLDLSNFDTSNVTTMVQMFIDCSGLESMNLTSFNTGKVTTMNNMFYNCSSLTSLDLSTWNTNNVTAMSYTFYGCSSLVALDLSNWKTGSSTTTSSCFTGCNNLQYLILNSDIVKFTIKTGLNNTCKILVPESALNTYKTHSAWSSKASQFDAIENYTITRSNGQVTITPNSS